MRVIVVGAGVVGVASAWYLNQAGFAVTVLDRQAAPAQETSFANGGQISVSHAEPWANPHAPLQALQWMGREDAPLLFRLRADPALWRWSAGFLRECTPARTRYNIRQILALATYSRSRLQALRQHFAEQGEPLAYDQRTHGILHIATDPAFFEKAQQAARLMQQFGLNRQIVSPDECVRIEPALAAIRADLAGGDYTPDDESGDAMKFTQALAQRAAAAGVCFRFGVEIDGFMRAGGAVQGVRLRTGETLAADACVLAAGSYSPLLARPLGLRLPVYPAKGYSVTIPLSPHSEAPQVSLTDDAHKIVMSRLGDRLRVAGTAEFNGYDLTLNTVRCQALWKRANALFPNLRPSGEPEFWCGLRPATPSNRPLIGRTQIPNLYLNTGHGTLGWTMACGSAAALADLLAGRQAEPDYNFLGDSQ